MLEASLGYTIRRLGPDQGDEAVRLLQALVPEDWREGALPEPREMAQTLGFPGYILIGAYNRQDQPSGYVSGMVVPSLLRPGDTAMLDDLFVAAEDRGRGLGAALVRGFREAALAAGRRPLAMWAATDTENAACDRAFRSAGGIPEEESFREYVWPTERQESPSDE